MCGALLCSGAACGQPCVGSARRQGRGYRGDRHASTRGGGREGGCKSTKRLDAPMVGDSSSKVSFANLSSSELFPTPESPTSSSLMRWSNDRNPSVSPMAVLPSLAESVLALGSLAAWRGALLL